MFVNIITAEALCGGTLPHTTTNCNKRKIILNNNTNASGSKLQRSNSNDINKQSIATTLKSGKTLNDEDTTNIYEPLDLDTIVADEYNQTETQDQNDENDEQITGTNNHASIIDSDLQLNTLSQVDISQSDMNQQFNDRNIGEFILPITSTQIELHTTESVNNILYAYQPTHIILYDSDIQTVRECEVYQAQLDSAMHIHIYFTMYQNSVEDQKYRTAINHEKQSFERLIHEKAHMVLQVDEINTKHVNNNQQQHTKPTELLGNEFSGLPAPTHSAYAALLPQLTAQEKRTGGIQSTIKPRIIVDMREFRSSLPNLLHSKNNDIIPLTLELGDYLLTPTMCVERKSIPDLIQSFQSGRLYNQLYSLMKYYRTPLLLIEFDRYKPFTLIQNRSELDHEINIKSIISKIVLLCIHFPQIRLLWSRDASATASLFNIIKHKQLQPEIIHAVTTQQIQLNNDISLVQPGDTQPSLNIDESDDKYMTNMLPQDILRKLPGVNQLNIRNLLLHTNSIYELCQASESQLSEWMTSSVNARKLYTFLHTDISTST